MTRSISPTLTLVVALGATALGGCAGPALDPTSPTDAGELAVEVQEALDLEPRLSGSQLTVREEGGIVVIGGFAESLEAMTVIDEVTDGIDGVASIENNAIVRPGS